MCITYYNLYFYIAGQEGLWQHFFIDTRNYNKFKYQNIKLAHIFLDSFHNNDTMLNKNDTEKLRKAKKKKVDIG